MALGTLATEQDLLARSIDVPDGVDVNTVLRAASAAIRDAAGAAITRVETALDLPGTTEQWLLVPLQPLHAVTAVTIDGRAVSDVKLIGGALWRQRGWQWSQYEPAVVSMTVDAGLDAAPEDIIDLCCSLAAASFAAIEDGYDPQRGLSSFSIDDYREGYTRGDEEVINPMDLPRRTREWLRGRFGMTAHVMGTYQ